MDTLPNPINNPKKFCFGIVYGTQIDKGLEPLSFGGILKPCLFSLSKKERVFPLLFSFEMV